jgi:probable rRNA maturation factor
VTSPASVVCADERSDGVHAPPVDVDRWGALAEAVLDAQGASGELTVTFVDVADIAELNAEHMGKDGPTDVLSFPLDDGDPVPGVPELLGDVVICPDVALAQCADHAGTFDDEIALLVVHGILHVLGHDHAEPDEAEVMRACELDLLTAWHWHGPPPAGFRQTHD